MNPFGFSEELTSVSLFPYSIQTSRFSSGVGSNFLLANLIFPPERVPLIHSESLSFSPPDPPERRNKLKPPASLSANQGSAGVILQWALPEAQQPPITGFVLQSRTGEGEWLVLDEDINANSSQMVVQGLEKVKNIK